MEDIIIEERPATPVSSQEPTKVVEKKVKVKIKKQGPGVLSYLADWFNKSLIVFLLAAIDFIWFLGAGNLNVFKDAPWDFIPETAYILLSLFVLSWLLMFAASLARFIQNLVAAALVGFWFLVLMNQFALFDQSSFLQPWAVQFLGETSSTIFSSASQWVALGIVFLLSWLFFTFANNRKHLYVVAVLAVVAASSLVNLYNQRNKLQDFNELYADKVITNNKKGNNFVFIAVPNLPSYRYLEKISPKYSAAKNTLNAMLGFYTRNGFMLFPNAYVVGKNAHENLAQSMNMSIESDLLVDAAKYENNWDFSSVNNGRLGLKSTELPATFEKNGYIRKVFEDNDIELCYVDGKPVANACKRRGMVPFALDNDKFSVRQRTMLLLGQWLGSMDMFSLNRPLYNVFRAFNVADVPLLGMDYAQVKTLGSIKTLDVLAEDIAHGKGNRAYFVWMNLPEQGFVYDEFCQVKPLDKWIVKGGVEKDEDKLINAYFEQTSCLFGKLADFMRQLNENEVDKNTVVVLQGVSGLEIAGLKPADKFEAENMVSMAIRDPKHNKFSLNNSFCSAPKIVRQYLFKKEVCVEEEGLKLDETLKKEVAKNIKNHNTIAESSLNTLSEANEWFRSWLRANYQDMVIPLEMPVLVEKEVVENKLQDPELAEEKKAIAEVNAAEAAAKEKARQKVKEIKLHTDTKSTGVENQADIPQEQVKPTDAIDSSVAEKAPTEGNAESVKAKEAEVLAQPSETAPQGDISTTTEEKADNSVQGISEKSEDAATQDISDKSGDTSTQEVSEKSGEAEPADIKLEGDETSQEVEAASPENGVESISEENVINSENKTPEVEPKTDGEQVFIIPQGDDKSDKIIIKIGAENENAETSEPVKSSDDELANLTSEIIAEGDETQKTADETAAEETEALSSTAETLPDGKEANTPTSDSETVPAEPEMLIPQNVTAQTEIDENVLFEKNDSELPELNEETQN